MEFDVKNSALMIVAIAFLSLFIFNSKANANQMEGNLNFTLGAKVLDKDDWEPAHEHGAIGLHYDFRNVDWPISIALGLIYSRGDGNIFLFNDVYKVELDTLEIRAGIRKIWEPTSTMRPFVGGGFAAIRADLEVSDRYGNSVGIDDWGYGWWISGGIYWKLLDRLNLGFDVGYSWAEVEYDDGYYRATANAGGGHAGLLLGFSL
jgi:hypothetical protein